MNISEFSIISNKYKAILFDSYGVLKTHSGLLPNVAKVFRHLVNISKPYLIVTNDASKSPTKLAKWYNEHGISQLNPEHFISSGHMAGEYLYQKLQANSMVVYMGIEPSAYYITSNGLNAVRLDDMTVANEKQMKAIAIMDFSSKDLLWAIDKILNLVIKYKVPVILANPDLAYQVDASNIGIASGAIAHLVEIITRQEVLKFGKPYEPIYQFAYNRLNELYGFSKSEVLFVGDTLDTDILGAVNFGFDTALVLSGMTAKESVHELISRKKITPTYICNCIDI